MAGVVGIQRCPEGAGVPGPGEGEVVQVEHRGNCGSGVEQPRNHGGVEVRDVVFQHLGGAGHGHPGDAGVVLQADPLPRQLPGGGPGQPAAVEDGVVGVVFGRGAGAQFPVWVLERRFRLREPVKDVVGVEQAGDGLEKPLKLVGGKLHVVGFGQAFQVVGRRLAQRHNRPPLVEHGYTG